MINKFKKEKITTDYGIGDYYAYYKENNNTDISAKLYSNIISSFNTAVIEEMLNNDLQYFIPKLKLELSIRKEKRKVKLVNGKIFNNSPVDWATTNKLWKKDKEAKEKKILVRYLNNHTSGYVFRIFTKKNLASFQNKIFYKLTPSRYFQRSLGKRINDTTKEKFECFLLYK